MRKTTLLLSIAVVVLAASTTWLTFELRAARAAAGPPGPTSPIASAPASRAPPAGTPRTEAPQPLGTPSNDTGAASDDELANEQAIQAQIEANNRVLFADPQYRRAMQAKERMDLEATNLEAARVLKLTPREREKLFDLLASQRIEVFEDGGQHMDALHQAHEAQLRELLGAERAETWRVYWLSTAQRRTVDQLRREIGSDALPDATAEALIAAMFTAQEATQNEVRSQAARLPPPTNPRLVGVLPEPQRLEMQRRADAKLDEAAAAVLDEPQLAAFRAMLRTDRERATRSMQLNQAMLDRQTALTRPPALP